MNYKYELLLTKVSEFTDEEIGLLLTGENIKLNDYELTHCGTLTFKEFKHHLYGIINDYIIFGEEGVSQYIRENLYIYERIFLMDMFESIDYRFMHGKLNFKEFVEFNKQKYDFCKLIDNSDPKEKGYKIVKSNDKITMVNYQCNNHNELFELLRNNGYEVSLGTSIHNATKEQKQDVEFTNVFIYPKVRNNQRVSEVYLYCKVDVNRQKTNTYKEDVVKYLDDRISDDMHFDRFVSDNPFEEYWLEQSCKYIRELLN